MSHPNKPPTFQEWLAQNAPAEPTPTEPTPTEPVFDARNMADDPAKITYGPIGDAPPDVFAFKYDAAAEPAPGPTPDDLRAEIENSYAHIISITHHLDALTPIMSTRPMLRAGVDLALVSHAVLVDLLIKKGILTETEYLTAVRDGLDTRLLAISNQTAEALTTRPPN